MANTDLGLLDSQLEEELGGEDLSPSALRRMNLLINSVPDFNAATALSFTLTGTTLDREATPIESRALVLFAALKYLRGMALQSAGMALSHTNVAGRTDTSGQPRAYERRIDSVELRLAAVMERLTDHAIAGEVVAAELGETKDILTTRPPLPIWGYGSWW
jgi:hypothetical protein